MVASDCTFIATHALRCPQILEQLSVISFNENEFGGSMLPYGALVCIATDYFRDYKTPPPRIVVGAEIAKLFDRFSALPDSTREKIIDIAATAYDIKEEELVPDFVIREGMLQRFVDEVKLGPEVKRLASITSSEAMTAKIQDVGKQMEQTRLVTNKPMNIFSRENRDKMTDSPVFPTGVQYIDMITGGLRAKCLFGVIAESSGGKTMFGVQYMCEQAMKQRKVMGLFYEQSLAGDITERFYSYLTGTNRKEIAGKKADQYSESLMAQLDVVDEKIAPYLNIFDMSGAVPGQGIGGTMEIENLIQRMIRAGNKPDIIMMDWLGPMVVGCVNFPKDVIMKEKKEKIDYVLKDLHRIREQYGVNICVLHQIAPAAIESKTPAYKPDWTVAAECKSFGHLMDYVFTFGRKCDKSNCMWFSAPKARGAAKASRIVRMEAEYSVIRDVTDNMEGYDASVGRREGQYFGQISGSGGPG